MKYEAILFDLDGTLIDSSADLIKTLNDLLIIHGREGWVDQSFSQHVTMGSKRLLEEGFRGDYPVAFEKLRQQYLALYEKQNTVNTRLYDGVEELLAGIESLSTPWGIMTNKPTDSTIPITAYLNLDERSAAIVCGDTLPVTKPDPSPIILACHMIGVNPHNCVYIGDSSSDVIAGKEAGMDTIACAYGYILSGDDISKWGADAIVQNPQEILRHIL